VDDVGIGGREFGVSNEHVTAAGGGVTAPTARRRAAAVLALVAQVAVVVAVVVVLHDDVAALLIAVAGLVVVVMAGWLAATRAGVVRVLAFVGLVAGAVLTVVVLVVDATVVGILVVLGLVALASALSRYALAVDRASLQQDDVPGVLAARARHPVLLMNPHSGGGKVAKFKLEEEARRRGVEPVLLGPGDDLEALARESIAGGADVLGMAGGDGSQALVAAIASEHGLPFVCIPAGTRNHFALDLGVDRDDVVGSLDAFAEGYERTIDLARVNGRIFVNNVSLGVYAEVVQSDEYRNAKMQTAADMLPTLLGPDAEHFSFELDKPSGELLHGACLVLVSNNVYVLDRIGGFGTRARVDGGVLGVVALQVDGPVAVTQLVACEAAGRVGSYSGWHEWTTPTLEIRSDGDIAVGVDGEALRFDTPLRFEILPGALRVRLARSAPGQSPAAVARRAPAGGIRELARVAAGRPA
jgi:diacylglycerol kinase family enzyme